MKRITAIELHNFLAFYGTDNKIRLPKGENLLLYGENGSGKSSLCRALEVFFEGKGQPDFDKNYRNLWGDRAAAATSIKVDFWDENFIPPIMPVESPSNIRLQWIEESRLASGFLTYREMLKTHFLEENRQNLFDLVVNEILRGYKSPTSGKILSEEWADFEKTFFDDFLLENWGDPLSARLDEFGDEKKVMDIISDLIADFGEVASAFDDSLKLILKDLNPKINEFLAFFEQNITVELVIGDRLDFFGDPEKGTMLSYHNVTDDIDLLKELRDRAVDPDVQKGTKVLLQNLTLKKTLLTAEVHYFGRFIPEHQTFLNEARLSALAICIFLAALRLKPDPPEGCKVLFLDDVLIGLDSGNRMPLLKILETHFQDFQVMISTYDRHWFEISKRFVAKQSGNFKWECAELFAKEESTNGIRFIKPVLHKSESSLARALYHFKNSYRPDYPAAVNYLRKAIEEIIQSHLPLKELKEQTGETKEGTRLLKQLLEKTKAFFERIHQPTITIELIREKLRTLLNPLSHFEVDTPVYQNEVKEVFDLTEKLDAQFVELKAKLREVLPQDSWVRIQFQISPTEIGVYRLKHKEVIYVMDGILSSCTFHAVETFIDSNGVEGNKTSLPKPVYEQYLGIQDAYEKIYNHCKSGDYPALESHADYLDGIYFENDGSILPLRSRL